MNKSRIAPWPDYNGNPISEGDFICHPDGQRGRVLFIESRGREAEDRWLVDYGPGAPSRLVLQIGDKGRAVVSTKRKEHMETLDDLTGTT